ncbi:MAG TPA: cytochrome c [Gemmataceae bacterium]|nr:cytochrome c [Gemmataceae bacterium]
MTRYLLPTLAASTIAILFVINTCPASVDKAPWTPTLPADVYKILTERSIMTIEATAKSGGDGAASRIDAEALILAGYTFSVKDASTKLRDKALFASVKARTNAIKELADFSKLDAAEAKADLKQLLSRKESLAAIMEIYRNKAKGGEGIHADLQYQPKLKNQNGIEALIGALASKKLNEANLDKVAVELPRLSYRIAVTANLTQVAAPAKGKERWAALSVKMRDASTALAESAQKKNADGIVKAADSLQNSCTECHREFRAK